MKIQEKQEYRTTPPGACEKTTPALQFYQRIKMSEIRCLDFRAFLLWKGLKYLCFMYWGASLMWLGDAIFE